MNKVKLTQAQIDAINQALESSDGNADALIVAHRNLIRDGLEWTTWPALNDVTPNELHNALKYGYEVAEQSSPPVVPQTDHETDLAPHDYASMIDLALATGDKAWFDELHAKMREGATM